MDVDLCAGGEGRTAGTKDFGVGLVVFAAVRLKAEEVFEGFLTHMAGVSGEVTIFNKFSSQFMAKLTRSSSRPHLF